MRRLFGIAGVTLVLGLGAASARATVVEHVGSVTGAPGDVVSVGVTLDDGGASVTSIQLDLVWDPATPVATTPGLAPACTVNPAIHKDQTIFAFQPFGCTPGDDCTAVRALVLSFVDQSPIPDGSVLVTCDVAIDAAAPGGVYPLVGATCVASDPIGNALPTTCSDGAVTVTAPAATLVAGKSLALRVNPTRPRSNALTYAAKDDEVALPSPSEDPRCPPLGTGTPAAGATLRVVGATADVTVALPCANWSANRAGSRLTYRDRTHTTCDSVVVQRGDLKAVCKGKHVAPMLGTPQGDVAVELVTGDALGARSYCASFGAATAAKVVKDGSDGTRFVARNASAPTSCPP